MNAEERRQLISQNVEKRSRLLTQLQKKASDLAQRIGVSEQSLPLFGESKSNGWYVDYDGLYHLIGRERNQDVNPRETTSEDEVMYWIFEGITFQIGVKYELANRISGQDFRRILFDRQLELLANLNSAWKTRRAREQRETLTRFPYRDE